MPKPWNQHVSGANWRAREVSELHHAVAGLTGEKNYVALEGEEAHTHQLWDKMENPL